MEKNSAVRECVNNIMLRFHAQVSRIAADLYDRSAELPTEAEELNDVICRFAALEEFTKMMDLVSVAVRTELTEPFVELESLRGTELRDWIESQLEWRMKHSKELQETVRGRGHTHD